MDLSAFLAEQVALIRGVWPEIQGLNAVPKTTYTSVQALKMSVVESIRSGTITTPCVVLGLGKEKQSEFGVSVGINRMPWTVFYIGDSGVGQTEIHRKLVAYRDVVDDPTSYFQSFQRSPEDGIIDSSDTSPVNTTIIAESGSKLSSGHVMWDPGLLVFNK